MRKAKIIGTVGPGSSKRATIIELIRAGLDVIRVNMSHGTYSDHAEVIKSVRIASKIVKKEVAILLDLQGPKIRVDKLEKNLILKKGEEWMIGPSTKSKVDGKFIPTTYKDLAKDGENKGKLGRVLFDDGKIVSKIIAREGDTLRIKVQVGGELKSNKGINLPDASVSAKPFTKKDKKDLLFGLKCGIDYVALSFVKEREDILRVKQFLKEQSKSKGKGGNIPIVAKIERPDAVKNIKEIVEVADAIMVARGDMGVELGNHLVPTIQKMIIGLCNSMGKPVITATQMLESMIENSSPTRAEASDVANAVWDGTDVLMLSGETAVGKYPVQTIKTMNNIIVEAERVCRKKRARTLWEKEIEKEKNEDLLGVTASLQLSAALMAERIGAKCIISVSQSGNSCAKMSHFRPVVKVLGVTNSIDTLRRMSLLWGIVPYLLTATTTTKGVNNSNRIEEKIVKVMERDKLLVSGDRVVITYGEKKIFTSGGSNMLKVKVV
ncbi:MAG: pyruvate kinase [Oligoflexia bacterium]|nr:pyruvate kinase [Oligoflexia bacterium]